MPSGTAKQIGINVNCEYCDIPVDYISTTKERGVVKDLYRCHKCGDSFETEKREED